MHRTLVMIVAPWIALGGTCAFGGGLAFAQSPVEPAAAASTADGMPVPLGGDTYTIAQGDTLWDISARMLSDPFYWPKLWNLNEYITNPHWIYPGNLLRFREGTEIAPPQFEVTKPGDPSERTMPPIPAVPVSIENLQEGFQLGAEEPIVAAPTVSTAPLVIAAPPELDKPLEVNLRQEGIISQSLLSPLGHIYKSESERSLLAEGDELYLKLNDASQAEKGKRFTVYRTLRRVRHPGTRAYLGYLVKILAELEIVSTGEGVTTAKVLTSYDSIQRGDPITEYVSVLKQVNITSNSASVEGMIVETMVDGATILGNGDVIYLDKGQGDGVRIGNVVDVVRRGDGMALGKDRDPALPTEVVGRLVVVGTQENTSTAVIVEAIDALKVGDKVRMVSN